jgi:hypothetical protein
MTQAMNRRNFFAGAAVTAVAAASVSRVALAALPEAVQQTSADTAAPWTPPGVTGAGRPYNPVVTLNGWTLPWRMNNGVKEFHLVAEPVVREMAPGFLVNMWGYNGQSPGPTIEVVEGDKVRIFVTNRLPELADPRQRNDHRSAHAAEAGAGLLRQAADRRSQAREAWAALQTHQALARLAQDLDLPQQEALEQAVLQRYNGMFVSTWALLAAARERLAALDRLTDARLAYWLAEADWRALLAGGHYAGAQRASNPATPGGNAAQGH